jgi:hypothetical protein
MSSDSRYFYRFFRVVSRICAACPAQEKVFGSMNKCGFRNAILHVLSSGCDARKMIDKRFESLYTTQNE